MNTTPAWTRAPHVNQPPVPAQRQPREKVDDRNRGGNEELFAAHAARVAGRTDLSDLINTVAGRVGQESREEAVQASMAAFDAATAAEKAADTERAHLAEALDLLNKRLESEPLTDLVREVLAVAFDPYSGGKAGRLVGLIRSTLVAPCPAWCVVPAEEHHANAGGFSPLHKGEPVALVDDDAPSDSRAEFEVALMRWDSYGLPGRAFADLRQVSSDGELSPDMARRLAAAVVSVSNLAEADRADVAGGAR